MPLRPRVESSHVDDDLAVRTKVHTGAIHRSRRRTLKIDALTIVTAAMAGALELVLRGFPIRGATQMSTARIDDEQPVRRTIDPDPILLQPFFVDAQPVIPGIADLENRGRLKQHTG